MMNQNLKKLNFGLILLMAIYLMPVNGQTQSKPENLFLKDYRPKSIYKIGERNGQLHDIFLAIYLADHLLSVCWL
jgi:hypothetical protein